MDISILIVSHNRKDELSFTLSKLEMYLDYSKHEILVFLDGCNDTSLELKTIFPNVVWSSSKEIVGASRARNILYRKAKGYVFIGFDDDSHPLQKDFISIILNKFENNRNIGALAFQELKGLYSSDLEALAESAIIEDEEYYTNEFIGCGFAIRKDVYNLTNGFPEWIDIYGEESCVAIEVLANGFDIMYISKIKVNHRVNETARKNLGHNYFRFGKQLKNSTYYYLVYYRFPIFKILKLYWHNLIKYAFIDKTFFKIFFKTIFEVMLNFVKILKYRNPVNKEVLMKKRNLETLKY